MLSQMKQTIRKAGGKYHGTQDSICHDKLIPVRMSGFLIVYRTPIIQSHASIDSLNEEECELEKLRSIAEL